MSLKSGIRYKLYSSTLLIGVFSGFTIKLAGSIYIGEIFAILYLLWRVYRGHSLKTIPSQFYLLAFLWATAQLGSDFINNIEILESIKGVFAPLLFIFSLAGLFSFFAEDANRLPSYLLGLPFGLLADVAFLNPTQYFLTNNQWKWGFAGPVTSFTIVLTSFFIRNRNDRVFSLPTFLSFFGIATIGLANDSRGAFSLILIYLAFVLSSTSFFRQALNGLNLIRPAGTYLLILLFLLSLSIASLSLGYIFTNTFVSSWMPEATYSKTLKQSKSSLGLIAGGRSEFFASTAAFLDKPMLGHGSWAKDYTGYYNLIRIERAYQYGEDLDREASFTMAQMDIQLIPAHSFLMGSLVWAGALGGIFWLYILYWIADAYLRYNAVLNFYFFNGLFVLVWNIIFSPFAYTTRFSTAVFISSLLAFMYLSRTGNPSACHGYKK